MTVLGVKARNHPQAVKTRGADDSIDDRRTPASVFRPLHERWRFTLDVAASAENALCARYYDRAADGLRRLWAGHRVWCNPPYSNVGDWVAKAWNEMRSGCELVVMLLPANRTEQPWWQAYVEPWRDRPEGRAWNAGGLSSGAVTLRCEFLPGRLRFGRPDGRKLAHDRPPFGCVLLTWRHRYDNGEEVPWTG